MNNLKFILIPSFVILLIAVCLWAPLKNSSLKNLSLRNPHYGRLVYIETQSEIVCGFDGCHECYECILTQSICEDHDHINYTLHLFKILDEAQQYRHNLTGLIDDLNERVHRQCLCKDACGLIRPSYYYGCLCDKRTCWKAINWDVIKYTLDNVPRTEENKDFYDDMVVISSHHGFSEHLTRLLAAGASPFAISPRTNRTALQLAYSANRTIQERVYSLGECIECANILMAAMERMKK